MIQINWWKLNWSIHRLIYLMRKINYIIWLSMMMTTGLVEGFFLMDQSRLIVTWHRAGVALQNGKARGWLNTGGSNTGGSNLQMWLSITWKPEWDLGTKKDPWVKMKTIWIFIGRTDAEAEAPIFWPPDAKKWLNGKDPDAGKEWRREEKGTTENEMVEWHHQLNGHEFE